MTIASPKRILLVDDDPVGAELTVAALHMLDPDLPVAVVADGEEALDYLFRRGSHAGREDGRPVAVLLDLKMPKIDGHEVLRQIRGSGPLRDLGVVVLTSSDQTADRELSRRLGCDDYLVKPTSVLELMDGLRRCATLRIAS